MGLYAENLCKKKLVWAVMEEEGDFITQNLWEI